MRRPQLPVCVLFQHQIDVLQADTPLTVRLQESLTRQTFTGRPARGSAVNGFVLALPQLLALLSRLLFASGPAGDQPDQECGWRAHPGQRS